MDDSIKRDGLAEVALELPVEVAEVGLITNREGPILVGEMNSDELGRCLQRRQSSDETKISVCVDDIDKLFSGRGAYSSV